MKNPVILLLSLLFSFPTFGESLLTEDWVEEKGQACSSCQVKSSFEAILNAEAQALDAMEAKASLKKDSSFKLSEMISEIAVTRSGLLGLAAMRSNRAIELKWKKKPLFKKNTEEDDEEADVIIEGVATPEDLQHLSASLYHIAISSGKIKKKHHLKSNLYQSLYRINESVKEIHKNSFGSWKLQGMRLDLNVSASGRIWFFVKAGVAVRLRVEWKLKPGSKSMTESSHLPESGRFIHQALNGIHEATRLVPIAGFEARKIIVGVGSSYKKGFIGLWKCSVGFLGSLIFVRDTPGRKAPLPAVPPGPLWLNGVAVKQGLKNLEDPFLTGMKKSLATGAFFAESAQKDRSSRWHVAEIKTIHDISYTGFFGLADFSSRGVVEIDFKRIQE